MNKTADGHLGIDTFPTLTKKKKRITRFNKLCDRARAKEFELERIDDCSDGKYEVFSDEKELGITRICNTLDEVEQEIEDIEKRF